jgi:hypothetical protein
MPRATLRPVVRQVLTAMVAAGATVVVSPSGWRVGVALTAAVLLVVPAAAAYQVAGGLLVVGSVALFPPHGPLVMLATGVSAAGLVMLFAPPRRHAVVELAAGGLVAVLAAAVPGASVAPAVVAGLAAVGLLIGLVATAAKPSRRPYPVSRASSAASDST